ncbi:hypothetical protein ACED16_15400 [Enterobacter hormaechei]
MNAKKITQFLLLCLVAVLVVIISWRLWLNKDDVTPLECHARFYNEVNNVPCDIKSRLDVFLSMSQGKGNFYLSGSHSCKRSDYREIKGTAYFNYERQGSYYRLHFQEANKDLQELFYILREKEVRLKITNLGNDDYIVTTPVNTLMMCTRD